mmetsp:Transcript_67506/g.141095  ORF Transcript_67506/g.141095 Transcript_67506/m.141095 type:complete len:614 (-) Transcript_67506:127-1968(-)
MAATQQVIVVVGAGSREAIGAFQPTGRTLHEAPVFENDQRCLLSREPHKNSKTGTLAYGWIIGKGGKPLYAVQSEALTPPTSGWRRLQGLAPAPASVEVLEETVQGLLRGATALKIAGNDFFKAAAYSEAREAYTRALDVLDSGHSWNLEEASELSIVLFSNRAEVNLREKRWDAALSDAQSALDKKPEHEKALLRGALAAEELGRLQLAEELCARCLKAHPENSEARMLLDALQVPDAVAPAEAPEKKGLKAFSGYATDRSKKVGFKEPEQIPVSELPYHNMNLPEEQVRLMDGFFQQMREEKAKQAAKAQQEEKEYEALKGDWKAAAEAGLADGKLDPVERLLPGAFSAKGDQENKAKPPASSVSVPKELPTPSLADIDAMLKPLEGEKPGTAATVEAKKARNRRQELQQLNAEAKKQTKQREEEVVVGLHRACGEPSSFSQAAGEVYCCWRIPQCIKGREVEVTASDSGGNLLVKVRDVVLFNGPLFGKIRTNDILWSVSGGELNLTLTKGERSKLWEQLGQVSSLRVDEGGKVDPSSVPEPLSAKDRMDRFREMIEGEDGEESCYDDLPVETKRLVDALRRYKHARATGDNNALALAEIDLEEFGRLVV